MKKILLLSAMGALASVGTLAGAEEVGRVISSTPVIQQVAVPRQVCNNQPMVVQQPSSGGGAVVGGLTGGLIGNTVAHGDARGIATILGVVGGAMVGDSVERANKTAVQNVPQCTTQTFYENRTVGYNVVYEYAGKQFTVQMPYDPGPTIRLQVSPVAANAPDMRAAPAANANGRGVIVAPPVNGQAYGDQTTAQGGYPAAQGSGQPIGQVIGSPGQSGVVVNETGTPGGYSAEYYPYPTPTYHPYSYPYGYNAYGYYPYGYYPYGYYPYGYYPYYGGYYPYWPVGLAIGFGLGYGWGGGYGHGHGGWGHGGGGHAGWSGGGHGGGGHGGWGGGGGRGGGGGGRR